MGEGDAALFEKLRVLRRELAGEQGVPPFFIFADRSLRDMATRLPQNLTEFRSIYGVGEHKAKQYGEAFLAVIRAHCDESDIVAASATPVAKRMNASRLTTREWHATAIAAFQAGKSLDEAAEECGVQPGTVVDYFYHHFQEYRSFPEGIILPRAQVSVKIREQVFALFTEHGVSKLGPIYRAMNQVVEYLDLHLLRLEYLQGEL